MALIGDVRQSTSAPTDPLATQDRLIARDGGRVEMVPFAEIDWVAADGDCVRVHAGKRQLLLRLTMMRIEAVLPADQHIRIHRSTIVNVARVRALQALPNADCLVTLANGTTLRASRGYTGRLRAVLGVR